jgi:WD40 repeat protein
VLAAVNLSNTFKVWRVADRTLQQAFECPKKVINVSFAPDSKMMAAAGVDGTIGLFEVGKPEGRYHPAHEGPVYMTTFAPVGQVLLSAGFDGKIHLWNMNLWPLSLLQSFEASERVYWATFSPDGNRIASVGRDSLLRILNPRDGDLEQSFAGHEKLVFRTIFSPDGGQVVTAGADATIRLWDLTARQELFTLRLPMEPGVANPPSFDFRCLANATSPGKCWIAAPLKNNGLALYDLGQVYN